MLARLFGSGSDLASVDPSAGAGAEMSGNVSGRDTGGVSGDVSGHDTGGVSTDGPGHNTRGDVSSAGGRAETSGVDAGGSGVNSAGGCAGTSGVNGGGSGVNASRDASTSRPVLEASSYVPALVVWTTTPWTVPLNQAVCAGGGISYALARAVGGPSDGRLLLAAESRLTDLA